MTGTVEYDGHGGSGAGPSGPDPAAVREERSTAPTPDGATISYDGRVLRIDAAPAGSMELVLSEVEVEASYDGVTVRVALRVDRSPEEATDLMQAIHAVRDRWRVARRLPDEGGSDGPSPAQAVTLPPPEPPKPIKGPALTQDTMEWIALRPFRDTYLLSCGTLLLPLESTPGGDRA